MIGKGNLPSSIAAKITDLIGKTPLLHLSGISAKLPGEIIAKLEYLNPMASEKDRLVKGILEAAEQEGRLSKGKTIVEPSSGNTAISLACYGAQKGYKVIIVLPDIVSIDRIRLIQFFGAEILFTPGNEGMLGAVKAAENLVKKSKKYFMLDQFNNPVNPEVHRKETAMEIWEDTKGTVDYFVSGVGTGGTITGVGDTLKGLKPECRIIAVEPADSAVLSGKDPGYHMIHGIGAGFIPSVLNMDVIDEIIPVKSEHAYDGVKMLAEVEGILAGISSGAAFWAARKIASLKENSGKNIVVLFPDAGERYLSTWLFE